MKTKSTGSNSYDNSLVPGKTLHLTITRKWFYMILAGEKKEEYRELKPFYFKRLTWHESEQRITHIRFYNGWACSKKYPNFLIELKSVSVGRGVSELGAENGKDYFVIKLGKIFKQ